MADLLTLNEYRDLKGTDPQNHRDDVRIASMLGPISSMIRTFTGRNFGSDAVTEDRTFEYDGSGYLDIDDASAINSVSVVVPGADPYVLDSTLYQAMPPRRVDAPIYYFIILPGFSFMGGSPEMGFTRNMDILAAEGRLMGLPPMVTVNADWGWPDVPEDIKLAAMWTLDDFLARGSGEGLTSESIADYSRSWGSRGGMQVVSALPQRAQDILAAYQKWY